MFGLKLAFGLVALFVALIPCILLLILARLASNKNKSYKPFSSSERKQTIFEISAIAILGNVLLFVFFMLLVQVPYLGIFGVFPFTLAAYAIPMMIFWDFDLFDAILWSFIVLGSQLVIGYIV